MNDRGEGGDVSCPISSKLPLNGHFRLKNAAAELSLGRTDSLTRTTEIRYLFILETCTHRPRNFPDVRALHEALILIAKSSFSKGRYEREITTDVYEGLTRWSNTCARVLAVSCPLVQPFVVSSNSAPGSPCLRLFTQQPIPFPSLSIFITQEHDSRLPRTGLAGTLP